MKSVELFVSRLTLPVVLCGVSSTFRTQAPEYEFAFTNTTIAERGGRRFRHVVPTDILDGAAAVADEVMMAPSFRVETSGPAFDGNFAD